MTNIENEKMVNIGEIRLYKFYSRIVYRCELMERWKCRKCNYVFVGKEVPRLCPNCNRKVEFEMLDDMLPPFTPFYDD